jgi:hypothetical protein
MKAIAFSLLAFSANAAIIKRHEHNFADGPTYGAPGLQGFKLPKLEDLKGIPGLENFKFPGLNFAPPKDGFAAVLSPKVRKAMKIESIPPVQYKDARRVRITYGPYKVRASSVGIYLSS